MVIFEDNDKFEEFAIDQEWEDKEKDKEVIQQLLINSFSSQHWTMLFLFCVYMFPYVCTSYVNDKT